MSGQNLDAGLVVGLSGRIERKIIMKNLKTHSFESELRVVYVVKYLIEEMMMSGQIMLNIFVMNVDNNELDTSNFWGRLLSYSNHKRLYGGKAFFQKPKKKS